MGPWGTSPELTLSGLLPGATYHLQVDGYQGLHGGEEITVGRIPATGVHGIPALSTWGLALLAAALSMSALMMLRRKASR